MSGGSKEPKFGDDEAGMTLVELLVAMTLGVVVMGGVVILLLGAMRAQPRIQNQSSNVQTARWVLGRMTRELRNGIRIDQKTTSTVSFEAFVRHASCGSAEALSSTAPPKKCEITYSCTGTTCSRIEALPTITTGTAVPLFTGLTNATSVFTYTPSTSPTYVGITLKIPDSSGSGALTVSDGASLRNAVLAK
jgi:type II secretory pathway pseudopilin PulG